MQQPCLSAICQTRKWSFTVPTKATEISVQNHGSLVLVHESFCILEDVVAFGLGLFDSLALSGGLGLEEQEGATAQHSEEKGG